MRFITRRAVAVCMALAVLLVVSAGLTQAQTNSSSVTIADFQFTPATMQVAQGTTVTWTNNGPTNHTTTADGGAWDSGVLPAGKSFSFQFNTPGTFAFHCSIHPNMKGTITVAAAAASPAASASAAAKPAASPSASVASSATKPSASTAAVPAQLPKTGGGSGPSSGLPLAGGAALLAGLAAAGAVWRRRRQAATDIS